MNRETPVSPDEPKNGALAPEKLTCRKVEKADLLTQVVLVDQIAHRPHAAVESGDLHQGVRS